MNPISSDRGFDASRAKVNRVVNPIKAEMGFPIPAEQLSEQIEESAALLGIKLTRDEAYTARLRLLSFGYCLMEEKGWRGYLLEEAYSKIVWKTGSEVKKAVKAAKSFCELTVLAERVEELYSMDGSPLSMTDAYWQSLINSFEAELQALCSSYNN